MLRRLDARLPTTRCRRHPRSPSQIGRESERCDHGGPATGARPLRIGPLLRPVSTGSRCRTRRSFLNYKASGRCPQRMRLARAIRIPTAMKRVARISLIGAAAGGAALAGLVVFPPADRSSLPVLRAGLSRHILLPLRSSPVFHGPGTARRPLALDQSPERQQELIEQGSERDAGIHHRQQQHGSGTARRAHRRRRVRGPDCCRKTDVRGYSEPVPGGRLGDLRGPVHTHRLVSCSDGRSSMCPIHCARRFEDTFVQAMKPRSRAASVMGFTAALPSLAVRVSTSPLTW